MALLTADWLTATLLPLGVVAGMLTTLTGMGGGMFLLVVFSFLTDPLHALATTAPALLLGNAHRAFVYREHIVRRVAVPVCIGAFLGSLLGGSLAALLPVLVLHVLLVATTLLGVARALGYFEWQPPRASLGPSGFVVGSLAATSGGAGMLIGPVILATGLRGEAYVSTIAASAVAMHIGRTISYSASGLFDSQRIVQAAILAASIFVGNLIAVRVRALLEDDAKMRVELGTLIICALLALSGGILELR